MDGVASLGCNVITEARATNWEGGGRGVEGRRVVVRQYFPAIVGLETVVLGRY